MTNYIVREINKESLKEVFAYEMEGKVDFIKLLNKEILKMFGFESAIIYCYDKILTEKIENLVFDLDNIIEARIFNETCEIKIWRYDNIMRGSIFKEIKPNNIMEDEYILYPRETGGYSPSKLFVKK